MGVLFELRVVSTATYRIHVQSCRFISVGNIERRW